MGFKRGNIKICKRDTGVQGGSVVLPIYHGGRVSPTNIGFDLGHVNQGYVSLPFRELRIRTIIGRMDLWTFVHNGILREWRMVEGGILGSCENNAESWQVAASLRVPWKPKIRSIVIIIIIGIYLLEHVLVAFAYQTRG